MKTLTILLVFAFGANVLASECKLESPIKIKGDPAQEVLRYKNVVLSDPLTGDALYGANTHAGEEPLGLDIGNIILNDQKTGLIGALVYSISNAFFLLRSNFFNNVK